ncbi:15722_t:CDS:2 [Acaulospora colombiana]|uniref:15722_t:CDS:1 n=1 Tax=Acaulospora colombiana TaxID=27376 RepID=A0ACA9NY23_9GLOM|nr:15722_t:CDS:2 [Acaulospora colombiana]
MGYSLNKPRSFHSYRTLKMPALEPQSKVLLTGTKPTKLNPPTHKSNKNNMLAGGSGFLGAWTLKNLLESNLRIRAVVRSRSKADYLLDCLQQHRSNLEFRIVKDITVPGAFDEVFEDGMVQGVIHSASPMPTTNPDEDPDLHIKPAVEGTLSVLRSAAKIGTVKRVEITSSLVAALEPKKAPVTYTEESWNDTAVKTVQERGKGAPPYSKYTASKVLAERSAWEFVKEENTSFDLVTLLPSYIWGVRTFSFLVHLTNVSKPIISETTANIKGSNAYLLDRLKHDRLEKLTAQEALMELRMVDVRDLAVLHVQALLVPAAGGERILASANELTWQRCFDVINQSGIPGMKPIRGYPEKLKGDWKPLIVISREKAKSILGITYRPAEETIKDLVADAIRIGWAQEP